MKTNLDKHFKTNKELEKEGVWFDISEDVGFLLSPLKTSNPKVKAAFAKHHKPYARQIELGTIEDKKVTEISIKIFLQCCLLDWRGVEIDDKVVEFSPEIAMKFFMELPDLFYTLWEHCQDFKNYREEMGNS